MGLRLVVRRHPVPGLVGHMEEDIGVLDASPQAVQVQEADLIEPETFLPYMRLEESHARRAGVVAIVHRNDLVAFVQEAVHECAADETRPARDHRSHDNISNDRPPYFIASFAYLRHEPY